jgi:hypothetical protein
MKPVRDYIFLSTVGVLLIISSACTKSGLHSSDVSQDNTSQPQHIQTEVSETHVPPSSGTNISAILSSGVEVTANIKISNNVNTTQLAVYNAEIVKQDYELLKRLLLANKEIVDEASSEMAEARTDALFHYCMTSDGASLSYSGDGFTYSTDQHSLMQNILYSKEIDVTQFSDDKDLTFSTRDDAQRNIENILNQLNIEVDGAPTCYTLSFDRLQSICKDLNTFRKNAVGADSPLYTPLSCSEADACYIFVYQLATEGLPISTHSNGVFGDGSWTPGTSLYCFYSERGIVGMELSYTMRVTGQASPAVNGLSINQVLEKIDEKFNSMILSGDYQVNELEFEYVPIPIDGSRSVFRLIPAWRASILHSYQYQDEKSNGEPYSITTESDVVFHAITGEELISNLGST